MKTVIASISTVVAVVLVPVAGLAIQFEKLPGCCNTAGNVSIFHPAIAPDGVTVAFVEESFYYPDFVYDTVGIAGPTNPEFEWVTGLPTLYPSWSPDGARVAGIHREGIYPLPENGLWVYSRDPQIAPLQLAAGEGFGRTSWTSDGTVIVFGGPNGSILMSLASSATGPFTLPFTGKNPSWSEQGIAVVDGGDIWVKSATEERALTSGAAKDDWPSWSPDGRWVAFDSDRAGNTDVWIVSSTGGTAVQLTTAAGYDGQPEWSPDGASIVFFSDRDGALGLWKAFDLPDFTVSVEEIPWSAIKQKYRDE